MNFMEITITSTDLSSLDNDENNDFEELLPERGELLKQDNDAVGHNDSLDSLDEQEVNLRRKIERKKPRSEHLILHAPAVKRKIEKE